MMVDSTGHGGQGSVDKLTLQISPSLEAEALLSGTPSLWVKKLEPTRASDLPEVMQEASGQVDNYSPVLLPPC